MQFLIPPGLFIAALCIGTSPNAGWMEYICALVLAAMACGSGFSMYFLGDKPAPVNREPRLRQPQPRQRHPRHPERRR